MDNFRKHMPVSNFQITAAVPCVRWYLFFHDQIFSSSPVTLNTFAPMLLLLVPWKAAELSVLTDVPVVGKEPVGPEALLCHFLPLLLWNGNIHTSVQDTEGVVETSKVSCSSLKVCKRWPSAT